MTRYFIYIALPAALTRRVAAIERKYRGLSLAAPHVTLIVPREIYPGRREEDVVEAVRKATLPLASFTVAYKGVSYFGRKQYVYIPVRRTRALVSCHLACARALKRVLKPVRSRPERFLRPHITLVARILQHDGEAVWNALEHRRFAGGFVCTEIVLLRMGESETRWRLVRRFRLGE
jgi:2'-5' RNA ligase